MATPTANAAIAYMEAGWRCFPLRGKKPLKGSHGFEDATTDIRTASAWLREPDLGIGLATGTPSGVFVIDVDGPEGEATLRALQAKHRDLPQTVTCRTSRGWHLYFKVPHGVQVSSGRLGERIDIKAAGGYVVVPPSRHPSGVIYKWLSGRTPDDLPVADAPEWLIEIVTAGTNGEHETAGPLSDKIAEGERNRTLASLAGSMRRRGASKDSIRAALNEENRLRCTPPLPDDEVAAIADSVSRYPPAPTLSRYDDSNSANNADAPWGDPLPLGPPAAESLPPESLPPSIRDFVLALAESTQTPSDMAVSMAIAALSVALAGKAEIEVRGGYSEPLNIWTGTLMESGNRKSAVVRRIAAPLRDYEAERVREVLPRRLEALDKKNMLEKTLDRAMRDAARARTSEDHGAAAQEITTIRRKLEELVIPPEPRLLASDVTTERIVSLMAENQGRMGILDPEGDLFRILAGRYSGGVVHFGAFKKGWTSEAIRDDRMGRAGTYVRRPALTLGITMQPSVLRTLDHRESFRGEGLLARFLYAAPPSPVGYRKTGKDVPPLDENAEKEYARVLRVLLEASASGTTEDGELIPHRLQLSPEARNELYAFESATEIMLRPDGLLRAIQDWGAKLCGNVTRIAGLIHLAHRAQDGAPLWSAPVSSRAMASAVALGHAYIGHALVVFDAVEVDDVTRVARYVLRRAVEADRLTERDLFEACKGKSEIKTMSDLRSALTLLGEHNLARTVTQKGDGRVGRPPSPLVEINPKCTRNTRKTPSGVVQEGSSANNANVSAGAATERTTDAGRFEVAV